MTRQRRAANPAFQKTPSYADMGLLKPPKKVKGELVLDLTPRNIGKQNVCFSCGAAGGTLVKTGDNEYRHQKETMCRIKSLKK